MNEIERAIKTIEHISDLDTKHHLNISNYDLLTAIEALREKAEREKGCEWCGVKKLAIPIMYNGEECGKAWLYEADDGWALFLECNGEIDYVDVSSCPNCGRKLKETDK